MTDFVEPSFSSIARARTLAVAISHGGGTGTAGWIQPSSSRLVEDPEGNLATGALNAFNESHSASSFDVTIDTGEALVAGAYMARDTTTTVTLSSSTNNQTVFVGWKDSSEDTVIIGKSGAFTSDDHKIEAWDFDTDGSGVTSSTDKRNLDDFRVANANVEALQNLASGDTFSAYPIAAADVAADAITARKVNIGELGATGFDSFSFYEERNADISTNTGACGGVFFHPDGTQLYLADGGNSDLVEYSLSTAFDVSTLSFVSATDVSGQTSSPQGIRLSFDGTVAFTCDDGNDEIEEYALSTAYDLSTLSHTSATSVTTNADQPVGLTFNRDGTKMYVCGRTNIDVAQYSLSTAFDSSTLSHDKTLDVSGELADIDSIFWSNDGELLFVGNPDTNELQRYRVDTAFDIGSAIAFGTESITNIAGMFFDRRANRFYTCDGSNDLIREFHRDAA